MSTASSAAPPTGFWTRNCLLIGNLLANLLGVAFIEFAYGRQIAEMFPGFTRWLNTAGLIFDPLSFVFIFGLALWYEAPMRRVLRNPMESPPDVLLKARKRLLNEPYVLAFLSISMWLCASVLFPLLLHLQGAPDLLVRRTMFQCIIMGLVTSALAFFLVEVLSQNLLVPRLFPRGGIFGVRGVLRGRIQGRVLALFLIAGLIPCMVSLLVVSGSKQLAASAHFTPEIILELVQTSITTSALIFSCTGFLLAVLVGLTLVKPLRRMVGVLQQVGDGKLDGWVPVRSSDELGYTCEMINHMTQGLRERERMAQGLNLAGQLQQSLLPAAPPLVDGLDIAGVSLPCDETGGDYFDYIINPDNGDLVVLVGDVTGHGVPSALLMTTVRALVRMRMALPGDDQDKLTDINRQLCRDVGDSGNFMTLFGLGYTPGRDDIGWVRAGHDPALVYDPANGSFTELMEGGPALGVFEGAKYKQGRSKLTSGQVVLLGTDGIWETRSPSGEMFGKDRVRDILAASAHLSAQEILDEVLHQVKAFRGHAPILDDVTAVVMKAI